MTHTVNSGRAKSQAKLEHWSLQVEGKPRFHLPPRIRKPRLREEHSSSHIWEGSFIYVWIWSARKSWNTWAITGFGRRSHHTLQNQQNVALAPQCYRGSFSCGRELASSNQLCTTEMTCRNSSRIDIEMRFWYSFYSHNDWWNTWENKLNYVIIS